MLDFEFIRNNWLYIAAGTGDTLGIAIVSFLLASALAMGIARGRRSPFLPIKALSTSYVVLIDGIPLLLLIFFIFLGLPQLGIILPGFWAGVLALTVNYSSRLSEIFDTQLAAVEKRSTGIWLSRSPRLANEFTGMIKDSTIISIGGLIHDVYWRATRAGRAEFHVLEAYIIAALIYLILITIVSLGMKALKPKPIPAEFGPVSSI
jgi:His/Glu/Gln/Arg/opine family amino acid ABC transporter permease subunit